MRPSHSPAACSARRLGRLPAIDANSADAGSADARDTANASITMPCSSAMRAGASTGSALGCGFGFGLGSEWLGRRGLGLLFTSEGPAADSPAASRSFAGTFARLRVGPSASTTSAPFSSFAFRLPDTVLGRGAGAGSAFDEPAFGSSALRLFGTRSSLELCALPILCASFFAFLTGACFAGAGAGRGASTAMGSGDSAGVGGRVSSAKSWSMHSVSGDDGATGASAGAHAVANSAAPAGAGVNINAVGTCDEGVRIMVCVGGGAFKFDVSARGCFSQAGRVFSGSAAGCAGLRVGRDTGTGTAGRGVDSRGGGTADSNARSAVESGRGVGSRAEGAANSTVNSGGAGVGSGVGIDSEPAQDGAAGVSVRGEGDAVFAFLNADAKSSVAIGGISELSSASSSESMGLSSDEI